MTALTEETIVRTVWLMAVTQGSYAVGFATKLDAIKMRRRLYRVVKAARNDPFTDPQLHHAVRRCEILLSEESGKWYLTIRDKAKDPLLLELAAQLGITGDEKLTDDASESERRLLESLTQSDPKNV